MNLKLKTKTEVVKKFVANYSLGSVFAEQRFFRVAFYSVAFS